MCHKFLALDKTSIEEEKPEVEDNGQTIRPTRSPAGPTNIPLPEVEYWSDLAAGEDEQNLENKVAGFKVCYPFVLKKLILTRSLPSISR